MGRRRSKTNEVTTILWREIPAQVTASVDGRTEKFLMEPRFQHAIDRAAAVAGLTETDAYVAEWRRLSQPLQTGDDPAEHAATAGEALQGQFDRERLEAFVANGGLDPESTS